MGVVVVVVVWMCVLVRVYEWRGLFLMVGICLCLNDLGTEYVCGVTVLVVVEGYSFDVEEMECSVEVVLVLLRFVIHTLVVNWVVVEMGEGVGQCAEEVLT